MPPPPNAEDLHDSDRTWMFGGGGARLPSPLADDGLLLAPPEDCNISGTGGATKFVSSARGMFNLPEWDTPDNDGEPSSYSSFSAVSSGLKTRFAMQRDHCSQSRFSPFDANSGEDALDESLRERYSPSASSTFSPAATPALSAQVLANNSQVNETLGSGAVSESAGAEHPEIRWQFVEDDVAELPHGELLDDRENSAARFLASEQPEDSPPANDHVWVDVLPSPEMNGADAELGTGLVRERPRLGDRLESMVKQGPAACPVVFVCIGFVVVLSFIGAGIALMPPDFDPDFSSFLKTDVNSSAQRDAFLAALSKRGDDQAERRLNSLAGGTPLYSIYDVVVAYESANGEDISDIESLTAISGFEKHLREMPAWKEECMQAHEAYRPFCEYGLSFASYKLPSLEIEEGTVVPSKMRFDGGGRDTMPTATAIGLLEERNIAGIILPSSIAAMADTPEVAAGTRISSLRSVFRFGYYCCTSLEPQSYQGKQVGEKKARFKKFAEAVVVPFLREHNSISVGEESESDKVRRINVYFDGAGFASIELFDALWGDLALAGGSMAFVLGYLVLHTRSFLLGFGGLVIVILSVPLAYVFFAMIATRTMSIASFLSLFLIVGLGSDVVFVYSDFWRESREHADKTSAQRLVWTYKRAGKASFATTATTAISFFANLASVLRPLREFGTFMGLCVLLAWVLVSLLFAPWCLIVEEKFTWCSRWSCRAPFERFGFLSYFRPRGASAHEAATTDESAAKAIDANISGQVSSPSFFRMPDLKDASCQVRGLMRWAEHVRGRARYYVAFSTLLALLALVLALVSARTDAGVPSVFPESHNQNAGKLVLKKFDTLNDIFKHTFKAVDVEADVCNPQQHFASDEVKECVLFWCEAKVNDDSRNSGTCSCRRQEMPPSNCEDHTHNSAFVQRFVGLETLSGDEALQAMTNSLPLGYKLINAITQKALEPLLLQEWETGTIDLEPFNEIWTALQKEDCSDLHAQCETWAAEGECSSNENWMSANCKHACSLCASPDVCGWEDICFCGSAKVCTLTEDWEPYELAGTLFGRTSGTGGRRLQFNTQLPTRSISPVVRQKLLPTSAPVKAALPLVESALQSQPNPAVPRSPLLPPRNLAAKWQVPSDQRARIDVAFGLSVDTSVALLGAGDPDDSWAFQQGFEASEPWSQRHMLQFCKKTPLDLKVVHVDSKCWIEKFREFLIDKTERFPVPAARFDPLMIEFSTSWLVQLQPARDFFWVRDSKIKATFMTFDVDVSHNAQSTTVLAYKLHWDKYLEDFNNEASRYMRGSFHTSSLWVRAEAQKELIASTGLTLAIVVLLAFVGMLVFTGDCILSLFVVFATLGVVSSLAFFMTVVCGWPIGPIEVIALIVFIGYAVTYSLHIAHKYGGVEATVPMYRRPIGADDDGQSELDMQQLRYFRTVYALRSIGNAALGSAITTIGCALFLVFCTLTIFQRLGSVVFIVTALSIYASLGPLPAALFLYGPVQPGKCRGLLPSVWRAWRSGQLSGRPLFKRNALQPDPLGDPPKELVDAVTGRSGPFVESQEGNKRELCLPRPLASNVVAPASNAISSSSSCGVTTGCKNAGGYLTNGGIRPVSQPLSFGALAAGGDGSALSVPALALPRQVDFVSQYHHGASPDYKAIEAASALGGLREGRPAVVPTPTPVLEDGQNLASPHAMPGVARQLPVGLTAALAAAVETTQRAPGGDRSGATVKQQLYI